MTLRSLPHWFPALGLCVLVLIGSTAGRARAEEGAPSALESPTPRECTGGFVAGPAVGIPVGLGTAAFGAVLIYAATNPLGDAFSGEGAGNNSPGGIAGGSILVGAGLAAFLYSAIKLTRTSRFGATFAASTTRINRSRAVRTPVRAESPSTARESGSELHNERR